MVLRGGLPAPFLPFRPCASVALIGVRRHAATYINPVDGLRVCRAVKCPLDVAVLLQMDEAQGPSPAPLKSWIKLRSTDLIPQEMLLLLSWDIEGFREAQRHRRPFLWVNAGRPPLASKDRRKIDRRL